LVWLHENAAAAARLPTPRQAVDDILATFSAAPGLAYGEAHDGSISIESTGD
jgi:hypothetical protein